MEKELVMDFGRKKIVHRTSLRSEMTVMYEEYKFFTVDSEIKYGSSLNSQKEIPIHMKQIQCV